MSHRWMERSRPRSPTGLNPGHSGYIFTSLFARCAVDIAISTRILRRNSVGFLKPRILKHAMAEIELAKRVMDDAGMGHRALSTVFFGGGTPHSVGSGATGGASAQNN